jgi:hypothetical protein
MVVPAGETLWILAMLQLIAGSEGGADEAVFAGAEAPLNGKNIPAATSAIGFIRRGCMILPFV